MSATSRWVLNRVVGAAGCTDDYGSVSALRDQAGTDSPCSQACQAGSSRRTWSAASGENR